MDCAFSSFTHSTKRRGLERMKMQRGKYPFQLDKKV